MAERLYNGGSSFGDYSRTAQTLTFDEGVETPMYVSKRAFENGTAGIALGSGEYLHEGTPDEDEAPVALPEDLDVTKSARRSEMRSRIDTDMSFAQPNMSDVVIAATTNFDLMGRKAELIVTYASGRKSKLSGSPDKIINWLKNKTLSADIK